ncbi:MAG: thermonuclease family protein [Myxococcota bacterium]
MLSGSVRGLLLVLAASSLLASAGCDVDDCGSCGPCTAQVLRAVDGDTIVLTDGTEIRYLGMDTPEKQSGECLADEAAQRNEDLVTGRTVRLEYGAQCTGDRGRTLAWVHTADQAAEVLVNVLLVEEGLANLCRHEDTRYRQALENALNEAQGTSAGIWGDCDDPESLGACD